MICQPKNEQPIHVYNQKCMFIYTRELRIMPQHVASIFAKIRTHGEI